MSLYTHRRPRPGSSPGLLPGAPVQEPRATTLRLFRYGPDGYSEQTEATPAELLAPAPPNTITWIDVAGLSDISLLQQLGEAFGLHPLALEDATNPGQRPKVDTYGETLFIVLKELHATEEGIATEQISLFVGPHCVVCLQEAPEDPFEPVRERIRRGRGHIRQRGSDYLAYALVDMLMDQFFPILEQLGERIEDLEQELLDRPSDDALQRIYGIKRELLDLRRAAWPQREVVHALERGDSELIRPETRLFLRDVYDHALQVLELVETYRDLAGNMVEVYLSRASHRMNEVMKVLTVISTVFIPLTFLVGVYGMNFDRSAGPLSMPELGWSWGYPGVWLTMIGLAGAMLYAFRRRGWF